MIFASTSIIFFVLLLGEISAVDYSSTCEDLASTCDSPTPAQLDMYLTALHDGNCDQDSSVAEKNSFATCVFKFNKDIFQQVANATNSDQKCKDTIDFQFQNKGLIGLPGLVAQCQIVGNPLQNCFFRCVTCVRIQTLGFDPTDQFIQAFQACSNSTNGTPY